MVQRRGSEAETKHLKQPLSQEPNNLRNQATSNMVNLQQQYVVASKVGRCQFVYTAAASSPSLLGRRKPAITYLRFQTEGAALVSLYLMTSGHFLLSVDREISTAAAATATEKCINE